MSFGNHQAPDPDDYFNDTRMSFGDHLEELRWHLWRAIIGFGFALIIGFLIGKPMLRVIAAPVEKELQNYWDRYYDQKRKEARDEMRQNGDPGRPIEYKYLVNLIELKQALGLKSEEKRPALDIIPELDPIVRGLDIEDWVDPKVTGGPGWVELTLKHKNPTQVGLDQMDFQRKIGKRPALSTLNVQEAFMVYFQVALVTGFVLASPWIFYQVWGFIAAGLYPHEKKYVNIYLPFSLGLFLAGVLVCQFFVIPKAVEALLWFNEWLELEPDLRLNEWLGFAIFMPVVFGLSFQTPLVMLFVERLGVVSVAGLRSKRRLAWFLMAVFAAVITPSTDAVSMLFMWVPMSLLYELGILLCVYSPQRKLLDFDMLGSESESEELIEV